MCFFTTHSATAISERPLDRVHFAHSDLSALPLFEEAVFWGARVAAEVALTIHQDVQSDSSQTLSPRLW